MLVIPQRFGGLIGLPRAKAAGKQILFTDVADSSSALSTYTFSGLSFGPARADRLIVVSVAGFRQGATRDVSSVTIGGSAATQVVYRRWATSYIAALYRRAVPTGDSGTVQVSLNNTLEGCGVGVWALYGLESATPTGTGWTSPDNQTISVGLNVVPGSMVIAVNQIFQTSGTVSTTWSGVAEDFDRTLVSSRGFHSAGSLFADSSASPLTIQATCSVNPNRHGLVAAAWF